MRKVVPLSHACQVVSGPFEPVAFDVDGYQGDFPDKLFCKLSRRRKCKNEQSAITLPCLPVFFAQYDLCPTWVQVRINFCSNWAEVGIGTSPQFVRRCISFIPDLGIILPAYYRRYKLASSINLYRFTHFLDFPSGSIFVNCLLGKHPQSLLNATCGVGCAFILNTFAY